MEQRRKIKIIIIVLSILLGLSLLALGCTLVRSKLASSTPATVTVPDNLITPDEDTDTPPGGEDGTQVPDGSVRQPGGSAAAEARKAATIELYNKQPEENTPFQVGNMFPGDSETKYFRVRVSYHDKVTVHYKAAVRPGYEKLARVLQVRVRLLSADETLYDGAIADMPESLTCKLASPGSTEEELYYEITAYLDTGVGNEYQNKDLIADFHWWVEETGNLDSPQTGDSADTLLLAVLAACSGGALILLLVVRRRREERENG